MPSAITLTQAACSIVTSAEITLPMGGVLTKGRVISRKRDADGNTVGRASDNPILDTRTYNVEFEDGTITELTANKIAECMYAQCDPTGNQYVLLDCFVDFEKLPTAMSLADQMIVVKGRASKRRNTFGWRICCQWKDGSTTWESLKDLKESHPLEMAEYAVAQDIQHEPAFNWWVPQVLRLRARIISLVKKRKMSYLKKNMKFGIDSFVTNINISPWAFVTTSNRVSKSMRSLRTTPRKSLRI